MRIRPADLAGFGVLLPGVTTRREALRPYRFAIRDSTGRTHPTRRHDRAGSTQDCDSSITVADASDRQGSGEAISMTAVGALHERLVFRRRSEVLAQALAHALPESVSSVLDVGCGDGTIDRAICELRPGLSITGVDVLVRPQTHIKVEPFDGTHLPFADASFDAVMFVDVLHHTDNPSVLLREARRVARTSVMIKDHTRETAFADITLRFMDWVGNAHHGVSLPYNYWPEAKWRQAFSQIGLSPQVWNTRLGLYPFPVSLIFEHNLHFVTQLSTRDTSGAAD
jgi:SAM-dependent methyltransferase